MTHPFHPLFGREFELLHHRRCWGYDQVFYYLDGGDEARSIPASWTSAVADDPIVVISAGRSLFRVADLLELAKQLRGLQR